MEMSQSLGLRQDMRQLLTPRMIQSMEILQLPLTALEERIEQELQSNPVLEMGEADPDATPVMDESAGDTSETKALVVKENNDQAEDFERLAKISEYLENEEYSSPQSLGSARMSSYDGERDKKLDAMNNTAARGANLSDYLMGQWAFIECSPEVRAAGETLINYIDEEGYLRTELEEISTQDKSHPSMENLKKALEMVQTMEPSGIGARNLRECLLIQLNALENDEDEPDQDYDLERKLITEHLRDLEMNRYPQIARKLGKDIEVIKGAVKRLSRLHPHPGKLIGGEDSPGITPDATIYYDEDTDKYEIEMAHDPTANLSISMLYRKMMKDRACDKKTREFLTNNVRNARWLIESIEQRKSTIARVIRVVVDAQRDFFDKGPEFLKPLPMIQVADQLGIHVATVSRAVSEKWIQTPRGIYPLRRFFSGGTTNAEGEDMSWDAVKEKLKTIIENEDKHNPLNDDEIVLKLKDQGIDLARRTVAKYRKILDIPTARQRREY
ncbi:MAG TPA: RNA polymerase factor sigma-54 [Tepidisphaeraceae bacterium]|jgi:RNA polymerase sigma-54 factor